MAETENGTGAGTEGLAATPFALLPVEITISVGTARPLIRDLLALGDDAVLPLDRSLDDPVDLYVGDRLIARGELQEIGDEGSGRLGVRVTEVVSLPERG